MNSNEEQCHDPCETPRQANHTHRAADSQGQQHARQPGSQQDSAGGIRFNVSSNGVPQPQEHVARRHRYAADYHRKQRKGTHGRQVRGSVSVGELINTIAACVQKRMTAEDIAMFQMGTHPALTASPIAYPLVNAAEVAISRLCT